MTSKDFPRAMTGPPRLSRRALLNGLGLSGLGLSALGAGAAASLIPWAPGVSTPAWGQEDAVEPLALPLPLTSLIHHIGMSVRDVVVSARFYSRVVGGENVIGEREPFLRYFIDFKPGRVAIGQVGTLGSVGRTVPLIDHFCVDAGTYDDPAWRARLGAEGLTYLAQGVFADIDGIAIQVAGGEGGESLSAGEVTDLESLYTGPPLLVTHGYDNVLLRVRDIEATAAFWKRMFGFSPSAREDGVVWITDGERRVGWRALAGDEEPGVEHYGIKTAPFDRDELSRALGDLGATVAAFDGASNVFEFSDPDGIKVQLWPA